MAFRAGTNGGCFQEFGGTVPTVAKRYDPNSFAEKLAGVRYLSSYQVQHGGIEKNPKKNRHILGGGDSRKVITEYERVGSWWERAEEMEQSRAVSMNLLQARILRKLESHREELLARVSAVPGRHLARKEAEDRCLKGIPSALRGY
mmetsp:Transcript_7822/g.25979  ORF Transcript_7822/g.25979 Transcript_7822/m.25979 type:complete len:146 (+) Transcript_7822:30-467(+)